MIFGLRLIKDGIYRYGIIDCLLAVVFGVFIILLRRVKSARLIYRTILIMLTLLLFYWVNTGAIRGYASIWVLTYPPFAFFLMGRREGFAWTLLTVTMTAVIFLFPQLSLTGFVYEKDFISRHIIAMVMIIFFTYYYESVRGNYQKAMITEKERLIEQQNRLEELVSERTSQLNDKIRELEDGEKRFRLFTDNIDDLIWSLDSRLRFTYLSPSVTRMYGYTVSEAMALPHDRWNTPDSYRRLMAKLDEQLHLDSAGTGQDRFILIQLEHIKKDGTKIDVELKASLIRDESNRIIGFTGVARDISERIKAEKEKEHIREQLEQAQKMEAVGTLAGGLAHDFNNFLGGIMGSFELIQRYLDHEQIENRQMINRYLDIGLESSKKSADLIRQLLALSRRHELTLAPVSINRSLSHVYELCRNSFPKSVAIEFSLPQEDLCIMGEPAQIEQVILNLCINASHAMTIMRGPSEKQGGTLTIKCEEVMPDSMTPGFLSEFSDAGLWVRISVKDTGIGISEGSLKRIFEPFYSTKDKSEGTGLGLAISYSIVQKHGGLINVNSGPGKGSVFSVYLPVYAGDLLVQHAEDSSAIVQGSGTVLVIDDEVIILNIARGFLEQCGYRVMTAEGPDEGIEEYRRHHKDIDAVLIDYSMPGKNGLEVFMALKGIDGSVRALLSSGMLDNDTKNKSIEEGILDTVSKPYTTAELSVKIKNVTSSET